MKKQKLLPFLAAACCSFAIAGAATAFIPTYTQPAFVSAADSGTLLNGCDQVGTFWCAAGTSVNTDSAYVEQGSGSVCVSTAGWAPLNLDWGTNDVGNYSYVKMTVWSTSAVKLLAGDINFIDDPDCVLADLVAGKNEVTIPVEKLVKYGLTTRTIAPYVSGACTLYFDNFVGYMSAPASTTLLNACDSVDGFWCAAGTTLNTDPSYIEQGNGSVKMSFAGWAPMNINWGTSSIADYDYVKLTIWSSQAVKLLAGDINFNTDPNCILAELAVGKNEVMIPVEKLVQYGLTGAICAPYVSGDCTLYFDNFVGIVGADEDDAVTTPSSSLNNCDTADGTWVETNGNYTIESTLMTQGNASIRLNLSADNYFKLTLRDGNNGNAALTKEQLLTFDYLVLDINNVTSGNVDLFLAETQVATLAPDWNTVVIPMDTIEAQMNANAAQFTDGQFFFKVQAGCTLLVDNVRGMSQADLNNTYADFGGVAYSAATTGSPVCVKFGATSVTTLTSAQASAAGLPSGYTDNVIYATGGNQGVGVLLDFSALQIPYTTVETITFRVFFPTENAGEGYPDIRIYNIDGSGTYAVNYDASTIAGAWYDFVLKPGETFNGSHNFSHLATDVYLGQFEFAIRSNNTSALYIDSISYKLTTDVEIKDYDTPVITYHGESTVYALAGEVFSVEATASDKTQGNVSIKQNWSAGAVDASGKLTVGTHTLTLTATDLGNNTATKEITVIGVAKDGNAPVISLPATSISLFTGTKPQLIPEITDDSGYYTVTTAWSAGALDNAGRLLAGTHTLTVTATDLSGNSASKTLTVTAITEGDDIVDESTPVSYSLLSNGGSGSTLSDVVAKGTKITLPACPFEAPAGKSFSAWAIGNESGEQKQPGDVITLSGDTHIYAIWTHVHADGDSNHLCDSCNEKLTDCKDEGKDHVCDICGGTVGTHAGTSTSHTCEYCGQKVSECADGDNNHNCDICGEKLTDCADSDSDTDHLCDTCKQPYGDHDFAGGWQQAEDGHYKVCNCGATDTKVPHSDSDTDSDHDCDECGYKVGEHVFDSAYQQNINGHWNYCNCGQISETMPHENNDQDHACDVCERTMSSCSDVNTDGDHNCDICGATYGDHDFSGAWQQADDGHYKVCNCGATDTKVAHSDSNTDNNHDCDVCGYTVGTHDFSGAWQQANDGHYKVCNCGATDAKVPHSDSDTDSDHDCDECGYTVGVHDFSGAWQQAEDGHYKVCNCGATDTKAPHGDSDTDGDHDCDVCGYTVGVHDFSGAWQQAEDGHYKVCNCGATNTKVPHSDEDDDHNCDECGYEVSSCADDDNDHNCDVCGEVLSTCEDGDNDGDCDVCGEVLNSGSTDDNNQGSDVPPAPTPDPTPDAPSSSGGCFGSIGGGTVMIAAACALVLARKKKERD